MAATQQDLYETLGLDRNADEAAIKKAYRRLAMQYHPDRNADPEAAARFKEVNHAYEVLSDPAQRSRYDRYGHAGVDGNGAGQGFDGFAGFEGFGDIFDTFFGGNQRRGGRRGPARGADLRYTIRVSFEEAAFGIEKQIDYQRFERCDRCTGNGAEPGTEQITCPECGGAGEVRRVQRSVFGQFVNVATCARCRGEGSVITEPCTTCQGSGRGRRDRRISVKIPGGIDEGAQIRLTSEGDFGSRNGGAGNLYVLIEVEDHEYFLRDGDDIHLDVELNVAQAALGSTITIPTLDGDTEIDVPAGTQSDERFLLRGKGVPHLRGGGRGDQVVRIAVKTPTKLSAEQEALLQQLAGTMEGPVVPRRKQNKGIFDRVRDVFGS